MHTIAECPRCKIDFMYHSTDSYLNRTTTVVDEVGNNEISDIVICQECNNVEEYIDSISKQYDLDTYETYQQEVKYFWENGSIGELEFDGMVTIDKEEYKEDGNLKSQSFRILTEEEFNGRFKSYLQTCYPIQDDIWASRRWNKELTDYIDLGGCENTAENITEEDNTELPF